MAAGQRARILVVDDGLDTGQSIQQVLTVLGYDTCGTASTGEEALKQAKELHPDLVLIDTRLNGDMDGVTAAGLIREQYKIPVVYLASSADEQTVERAKLTRPQGYVTKPFEPAELHAVVQIALYRHSTEGGGDFERYTAMLEGILDGVMATDETGAVFFMNRSAEAITGWSASEALGKSISEIFPVTRHDSAVMTDSSVSKGFANETILETHKRGTVPVEYTLGMTRDEKGHSTGFVLVFRDISERRHVEEALTESRKKYKELVNSIDGIVWEADVRTQRYLFVSKQVYRILGYPFDRWMNEPEFWKQHLHPDDRKRIGDFWAREYESSGSFELEYRMLASDGRIVWFRDIISVYVESGQPVRLRGVMVNITELKRAEEALRKAHNELEKRVEERTLELSNAVAELRQQIAERQKAQEALRESEERYALAAQGANDGLWDWNVRTGQIYYSPRWSSMLGWPEDQVASNIDEWLRRVHPEDMQGMKTELEAHIEGLTAQFQNEHRMLHRDGTYRWMLARGVVVHDADKKPLRMAGSLTDITERKLAEEQLLHDAFHDVLTNLPNRALFMDRLNGANSRIKRRETYQFAVLVLDVDRFKVINDSLGHQIGDQLLMAIGRRLESCLRPGDTVARLGGDEFAILVEDLSGTKDSIHVAERVQKELQAAFNLGGNEVFVAASIGIAPGAPTYERGDDILRDADTAMFRAKALGRARHQVFNKEMHAKAVELLQLETDLRHAVQRDEFFLLYQPIVQCDSGRMTSIEALVRWRHPTRGTVLPADLIPLAEETGLIVPIGRWVLMQACKQLHEWHSQFPDKPPISLSVNLSGKQLSQPELIADIKTVLQDTAVDPTFLNLEITESVIMENAEVARDILGHLRALNVKLHVDDFGIGYSSLSYLHRFPVNTLKIDRSFVTGVSKPENAEIVRTIVTLARNLKMDVIAEGVESQEQLDCLRDLGCEMAQGYYFYHPLEEAQVRDLIEAT